MKVYHIFAAASINLYNNFCENLIKIILFCTNRILLLQISEKGIIIIFAVCCAGILSVKYSEDKKVDKFEIKEMIAKQLRIDVNDIQDNSNLVNDLGADSIDLVEMLMMIEENLGITITDDDIAAVISRTTGIPVAKIAESEGQKLMKMKDRLRRSVIGQDEAIDTVVRAIQRGRAGLKAPGRPVGTFLFFGPTGVGKTLLARRLAEYMFDSEDNLVRIDMSEYTEKISSSRLIGAPPGYVGYEEGGQLSEKVRRKPYCVILLDEIEKAHPDIYNLLLQVLDEGRLTDNNGHTVDFRNTIVIMTSNVGSRELDEYGSGLGFARAGKDLDAEKRNVLDKAIRKTFPPEFINRVDEKIYFRPLGRDQVSKIVDKEVDELCTRTAAAGYTLKVTEGARRLVAETGYDPSYGARPLGRAITRLIENPVAEFIITDRILGKKGTGSLRVALSRDKESTIVTRTD